MRAATMFSGIGAPEVARPEWDWRWCAEIEKFPSTVHALRHSQGGRGGNRAVPNLGDVSKSDFVERAKSEGAIDILVFGSPCQSFSVAGKRLGLDDPRGNLALISLEIARQLRPRWLVFENVPGLLSSDNGRDFGIFLRVMEECGYFGAWRIIDAQYCGVPQRRRRIFFVGYLGDWRPSAAVLFECESLRGDTPPSRKAREGIAPTISARTKGGDGLGSDFEIDGGLIPQTAWALQERDHKGADSDTKQGHLIPVAVNLRGRENGAMPECDDVASVRAADGGSSRSYICAFSAKDHGGDAGDTASTLRADGHSKSHANAGVMPAVADHFAVRRLTPRECERLQGFPDDFTRIEWRGKPESECPDGPRYKALGNSMAVPVMGWILGRIETFEKEVGRQAAAA